MTFATEQMRVMQFCDFMEALCRLARFLSKRSNIQDTSKSLSSFATEQQDSSSSWGKIRELSTLHSIFLKDEGRFLSIQNGGLVSKLSKGGAEGSSGTEQASKEIDGLKANDYHIKIREIIHKIAHLL